MVNFWRLFASCIFIEPLALAVHFRPALSVRTKVIPCVEVWQTSNQRWLRIGEENKKNYTVSQKRPTLASYNFGTREQILIFLAEMLPIK